MQDILLKIGYFESGISKSLKKVIFIFLSNLVSFNGQDYKKQKGNRTSDKLLFSLQSKFRKILLLVMYYLNKFDEVI